MKAVNTPSKLTQIKYPRETPRISRKRVWADRQEWRKDPQATLEMSKGLIDTDLEAGRSRPNLEQTNYNDFADLVNRAGRVGIRKV